MVLCYIFRPVRCIFQVEATKCYLQIYVQLHSMTQMATVLLGNVVILVIIVESFLTMDLKRLVQPLFYVFWAL